MTASPDRPRARPPDRLVPGCSGPINALVVGAGGGIGSAIASLLAARSDVATLFLASRITPEPVPAGALLSPRSARLHPVACDLTAPETLEALRAEIAATVGRLHLVINAAGVLHDDGLAPEKTVRQIDPQAMAKSFAVNATGVALLARALWPLLVHDEPTVFASLSARVGSIGDNRLGGWYAYRASKAAHNQLLRTFAIELARSNPRSIVLALHPGTVDTALSRPYQGGVRPGQILTPAESAAWLTSVLADRTPADTGGFFAWDGQRVPW